MNILFLLLIIFTIFNYIGIIQINKFNKNSQIKILNSNNKIEIVDNINDLSPFILKNTCSNYDILNKSKLQYLLDNNRGYIINDNNKNITFKTFDKSDKISLYHNSYGINDFNMKNDLNDILKYFNTSLSCNNKHYLNIFKGKQIIDTIEQKNNICVYTVLEGTVTFYLINPKFYDNITNDQYKKWSNKIILNQGEILYIPPNWKYNFKSDNTVVMTLSTSDKYNTYIYNLLK